MFDILDWLFFLRSLEAAQRTCHINELSKMQQYGSSINLWWTHSSLWTDANVYINKLTLYYWIREIPLEDFTTIHFNTKADIVINSFRSCRSRGHRIQVRLQSYSPVRCDSPQICRRNLIFIGNITHLKHQAIPGYWTKMSLSFPKLEMNTLSVSNLQSNEREPQSRRWQRPECLPLRAGTQALLRIQSSNWALKALENA